MSCLPGRPRLRAALAVLGIAAAALTLAPESARTQGLFDLLFGVLRGAPPPMNQPPPPHLLDRFSEDGDRQEFSEQGAGPYTAYCVRLCDGRYFPLPADGGDGQRSAAQVCSALCPAAETRLYSGTDIERAITTDGTRYSDLEHAFLYRERLVAGCNCNGREATGVADLDPRSDPTLRRGDIVVTKDGPMVFRGRGRPPHGAADFVPARNDRRLPASLRKQLSTMRVAPEHRTATGSSTRRSAPVFSRVPDDHETRPGANPQN